MTETTVAARRSITVQASPERAFAVFTTGFSSWWPIESHHIGATEATEVIMETHAGGRWFERDADGNECDWGYVTDIEPPRRVLLAWHLTPEWTFDPDPAKATEPAVVGMSLVLMLSLRMIGMPRSGRLLARSLSAWPACWTAR